MARLPYVFNDGGRAAAGFTGSAGDCVVRAVAIATEQPYLQVYEDLSTITRNERRTKRTRPASSARDGVYTNRKAFKDYMARLGWFWTPTMRIGSGCKVHLAPGELPGGRLVVAVSRHYTAVLDGVVHDTYDPQREVHELRSMPLSDGRSIAVPTGHVIRRCVYGYWQRRGVDAVAPGV